MYKDLSVTVECILSVSNSPFINIPGVVRGDVIRMPLENFPITTHPLYNKIKEWLIEYTVFIEVDIDHNKIISQIELFSYRQIESYLNLNEIYNFIPFEKLDLLKLDTLQLIKEMV